MAINIEIQGDFQYLKYEFAPRLRQLVKNVHTAMNSYNNAFFLQCQKFGDVQAIAREAQQSGKLPTAVEQAMLKADAFNPLAEGILLKKVANQISSLLFSMVITGACSLTEEEVSPITEDLSILTICAVA